MTPPFHVPEPLRCWKPDGLFGWWMVAFIAPGWRYGVPVPPDITAERWAECVGLVVNKARNKGYIL